MEELETPEDDIIESGDLQEWVDHWESIHGFALHTKDPDLAIKAGIHVEHMRRMMLVNSD